MTVKYSYINIETLAIVVSSIIAGVAFGMNLAVANTVVVVVIVVDVVVVDVEVIEIENLSQGLKNSNFLYISYNLCIK